ncbi:hypothetical protein CPB84DRAFT_1843848 [Gymnopilus junonius]|uniref:Protein kinase domain-containing protein n=1 Tax=Gymnopilus junonius TaxID=109634 RepID=A0A9P5TQW9_GYMJU|nr:hypothetical protein CPB84DRAFT_1843848 [Gymnopilus junonius]
MLPSDNPFSILLKRTLEANYNPEISQVQRIDPLTPLAPISFYDRHIASHLILENIVYLPSITQSLSKTCETELQSFFKDGGQFSSTGYNMFPLKCGNTSFYDATDVSSYYHRYIGSVCTRYAYKLALRPDDKAWGSPLYMDIFPGDPRPNLTTEAWLEVPDFILTNPELFKGLSKTIEGKLKGLLNKYPRLATWDMFAMTEEAQKMFQTLRGNQLFKWETCRTLGSQTLSHSNPPPDARKGPVLLPVNKRLKYFRGPSSSLQFTTRVAKTVTIPKLPPKDKSYRPDFRHHIQHAWARAAMYDSTFIILHCGRYERIGIRHRGSKTLFLSGVIDTINIENPSYRKLHKGKSIGLKRSADHFDNETLPKTKRPKNTPPTKSDTLRIANEIARRKLALVRLEYGAFCSPVPSAFVDVVLLAFLTLYTTNEYFTLTLGEPLGHGAVGIVHPARLELTLESGEILTRDLAMKFAFTPEQQKMMGNEYFIYGHLSRKEGLEGIVTVHGLFLDPETRTLGMLMDNGGLSLRRREIDRACDILVTERERKAFINALKSLHKAGVRHNDLRSDNLLINSRNEVFIIDFDRADLEVDEGEVETELACLEDVLDGSG